MQDRIIGFISSHCHAKKERLEEMMLNTGQMSKDLGTILVGEQAVEEGVITNVGGIKEAIEELRKRIEKVEKF
jgi:ATP-dependent protease ClpP protease subunit